MGFYPKFFSLGWDYAKRTTITKYVMYVITKYVICNKNKYLSLDIKNLTPYYRSRSKSEIQADRPTEMKNFLALLYLIHEGFANNPTPS